MNRIEHREEKWAFPFVEYSPKEMKKGLPLIIQLHGAGERGDGKEELSLVDVHGFSSVIADRELEAIVIMPQCPKGDFWAARVESLYKFVNDAIEYYGADKSRVTLTGLSMGGFGTWFLAMAHPEAFAAIAPLCGGGMPWNAGALTMPVWAFHGDSDATVSFRHSSEMVDKLKALGRDVKFTVYEGVGHSIQKLAYNEELLNWLLSKKK